MADNILALIAATAVLILIPGPNVALIVANSLKYGYRHGFVTVLGTTLGVGLQLLFVIGGFAMLIDMAATAGSTGDDFGRALSVGPLGQIVVAGSLAGTVSLGSHLAVVEGGEQSFVWQFDGQL